MTSISPKHARINLYLQAAQDIIRKHHLLKLLENICHYKGKKPMASFLLSISMGRHRVLRLAERTWGSRDKNVM